MRRRTRLTARRLSWALIPALTLSMVAANPAAAEPDEAATPPPAPLAATDPAEVTLVTGDRVTLEWSQDGAPLISTDPAPRAGRTPTFRTFHYEGGVYVLPSDAAALIPDTLDLELFNVAALAEIDHDGDVPVIVTYDEAPLRTMSASASSGMSVTTTLPSINAVAATVAEDGDWWRGLQRTGPRTLTATAHDAPKRAAAGTGAALDASGIDKVWLDAPIEATLEDSVPLVGAPEAWDAGYDGGGVTVAVLDTGVDKTHADLAGKVIAEADFTNDGTPDDLHGHGTHVAGTVVGSGAASDGDRTGVAPGAEVINGKVLDAGGNGLTSWILSGMEWAADQGADVINMSLGGGPTDGSDPLSQAVNRLTDSHDTLFVIAAGNSGPADQTVGAPGAADAALTVANARKDGTLANRSSRGPRAGDFALKPDITAPGTAIVAPAGTNAALPPPFEPVGEHYARASGTSMASPHVAGAAAILLQQRPDLTPAEVKATLAGSADPHPAYDVYQEGGGHLNIPAALDSEVRTSPNPLDLGYHMYPHDGAESVDTPVSVTNVTDDPVTLDLSLQVRNRLGIPAAPGMLELSTDSLTIDGGASAEVTVTLDRSVGALGLYSGHLVATTPDGEVAVRTPLGYYKEPERYDLRIEGTARDGSAPVVDSQMSVFNTESLATYFRPVNYFDGGAITLRVPPGTYAVMGAIYTYDEWDEYPREMVLGGDPQVEVTDDTTVVFDARDSHPVTSETPMHPDSQPINEPQLQYQLWTDQTGPMGYTWVGQAHWDLYVQEMDPVPARDFEFMARLERGPEVVELALPDHPGVEVSPDLLFGSPPVWGADTLPLVDAGQGTAADYQEADVEGALAYIRRTQGLDLVAAEAAAAEAGASALVIANVVPGRISGRLSEFDATIPVLEMSETDGDALADLLADGSVTVELDGTATPSYLYDMAVVHDPGGIPAGMHYVPEPEQLATVEMSYHKGEEPMSVIRWSSRPYHSSYSYAHPIREAHTRTEYYVGGDDVAYKYRVHADRESGAYLELEPTYWPAGGEASHRFYAAPLRPIVLADHPATRSGDRLRVDLPEWADQANNWSTARPGADEVSMRLYRGGELAHELDRAQGNLPLADERAQYRLELDVARPLDWWRYSTRTHTAWSFESAPGDGGQVVPLLSLDYDVPVGLDNATPHPRERRGPATFEFEVSAPGAGDVTVDGARVWISHDDGQTWRKRVVKPAGDGRFSVILPGRAPAKTSDALSVRVEAWDTDGNRVEQELIRAWQLPPRGSGPTIR